MEKLKSTSKHVHPRAKKIRRALAQGGYDTKTDLRAALTDALADIRHCCDQWGLDFAHIDAIAYQHYIAENGKAVES
jgi:hypothetical protein